jgi:hypothetical protein
MIKKLRNQPYAPKWEERKARILRRKFDVHNTKAA